MLASLEQLLTAAAPGSQQSMACQHSKEQVKVACHLHNPEVVRFVSASWAVLIDT